MMNKGSDEDNRIRIVDEEEIDGYINYKEQTPLTAGLEESAIA